jgi:hypothetical protein
MDLCTDSHELPGPTKLNACLDAKISIRVELHSLTKHGKHAFFEKG